MTGTHQRIVLTLFMLSCLDVLAGKKPPESRFPEARVIEKRKLVRQGAGVLKFKNIIPVYDAALYLDEADEPGRVLEDIPKRIEVMYRVNAKAERFNRAGRDVLKKNYPDGELEAIEDRLETLEEWYPDARKGDRCAIQCIPGHGTELTHNGRSMGVVPGADFARLYFSIWLGDRPASVRLRNDLLNIK